MNSEWYSGRFRKLDPQRGYLLVSMFATGNLSIGSHLFLFIECNILIRRYYLLATSYGVPTIEFNSLPEQFFWAVAGAHWG
jgi:hypothetical protein